MAKLTGEIQFTGSLGDLSYYKMHGSDKIIVRKKGGPSRRRIKIGPEFEMTRLNNMEFGGRATAVKYIKRDLYPLMFLADYNITGPLNALLKPLQEADTINDKGQRNVLISKNPRLLEGFSLNRRYPLESIVRAPFSYSLQGQQVIVEIPALIPGINFITPANYPFYQFIAVTTLVPDFYFKGEKYKYQPSVERQSTLYKSTDWLSINTRTTATQLIIEGLPAKPENSSMLVALGISFGAFEGTQIEWVKYVGAAKVIGMV